MKIINNSCFRSVSASFLVRPLKNVNVMLRLAILLALVSLFSACASSSSSSPPSPPSSSPSSSDGSVPRNLFSHASYHFALANTTTTSAVRSARILGVIRLEDEAVRSRLPVGAGNWTVTYALSQEDNELVATFFKVVKVDASSGELEFNSELGRAFSLGYVVNVLGVSNFNVIAEISYLDANGETQMLESVSVPVRISAAAREQLQAKDFFTFKGSAEERTVSELVNVTRERGFNGRVIRELNRSVADLTAADFVLFALDADGRADAAESDFFFDPAGIAPGTFVASDLWSVADDGTLSLNQALDMTVLLRLTNGAANHRNLPLTYALPAGTTNAILNGNHTEDTGPGSFRHFVANNREVVSATANEAEDIFNISAARGFGVNLMAIEISFSFAYERAVLIEEMREVTRRDLSYRRTATIGEDALSSASASAAVSGVDDLLVALGIERVLPEVLRDTTGLNVPPTLYFRLRDAGAAATLCEEQFYLDNQGHRILLKSDGELDYERVSSYGCRLEVSLTGLPGDYAEVTTGVLANATAEFARTDRLLGSDCRDQSGGAGSLHGQCGGGARDRAMQLSCAGGY